jgi:hypothetical protein
LNAFLKEAGSEKEFSSAALSYFINITKLGELVNARFNEQDTDTEIETETALPSEDNNTEDRVGTKRKRGNRAEEMSRKKFKGTA